MAVPEDILADNLKEAIKDAHRQSRPNREQFLDALQRAVGQRTPSRLTRFILAVACDEEGLEN